MPDNFQQIVDLRRQTARPKKPAPLKETATPIEKIYQTGQSGESVPDMKKINRPKTGRGAPERVFKIVVLLLAALVVCATVYFLFFRPKGGVATDPKAQNWYAVKLIDGTVYYGQIFDLKANPLIIKNTYYNYDQAKVAGLPAGQAGAAKDQAKTIEETGNLRLVKRGKETQGGDGSIIVYPSNGWPIIEPLRADSKVLQAILEYEK